MTESSSVLIFGGLHENGSPDCVLLHRGREAYENYMLGPYMRELLSVRNDPKYICWSPGFEHLYAAMLACNAPVIRFEELGSTLFSTVDKFDKLASRFPQIGSPPRVQYYGIEISRLLRDVAETLHPHRIRHFDRWQDMEAPQGPVLSRSFQSTSYAFRSTAELFGWISRAEFGIHGVRFSLTPGDHTLRLSGNDHTFFDANEFAALAKVHGLDVTVIQSEISRHGKYAFATTWLACSRLGPEVLDAKDRVASSAGWPLLQSSQVFERGSLAASPEASRNQPWLFYEPGNEPFDFRHRDLSL